MKKSFIFSLALVGLSFFSSLSYAQVVNGKQNQKLVYTMRVGKSGFNEKEDSSARYFTYYLLADTPYQYRLIGFDNLMIEESLLKEAPFVKDKCPVNTTFLPCNDYIRIGVHLYLEKCWATGVPQKKAISHVVKTYLGHRSEIDWTKFL